MFSGKVDKNDITQSTGTSTTSVMSQKAVTEISDKVDTLSEELEGIDALKDVINKKLSPFNKVTFDDEKYYSGNVNVFISGDAVDKNISINQLKLRVNKVSGASYKLKLVECEASGKLKITKLSNEISLTEPSGDFNDETISLETAFNVAKGHKYGLIISDVGILKKNITTGVSKYHIRDAVYSQKVVGSYLLPYAQEPIVSLVNINFIFVREGFITPVKEEDFKKSIGQKSDNAIESDNLWGAIEEVNDKSLSSRALLDMKLDNILADVEYEVGAIDLRTGNNTENNRYTRTKNIHWLNKGTHVFSTATTPFWFFKYDNNLHFERIALSNGTDYEITESGYYRWSIVFPIDVTTLGDSIKHGGYIYFGYNQQYDYEERNAINYAATQVNPFILSRKEEKMAHVSNFQFDNDGTMWLAYIGNETTTDENEKQVVNGVAVCYCNIVHVNPYTGEELGRTTFKAGESIGDYTQPNEVAPYVPYINLISEGKVHVQFWAHMNGELTLAKFDVDKSSLEKTNFAAYTIKYNGATRVLNPTGLKETYEAISGETIEDFDHVDMTTHYSLYDGYWYSVINNVFGTPSIPNFANQKFRSILVRSIDCVNWEVVHCYQEIPFTCECCMCIKNGVVYTTDRNNYVSAFNLTTKEVRKTLIPLGAGCKTSVFNYKGNVVFAATIPCKYDVDKQSYRGNLGLYKINEDLSIELLSRIMTNHGMHYPDLGSDGFDIFMSWSEDRRHIMLKLQRSNIGFSRIQL